jgi:hypothetical protein
VRLWLMAQRLDGGQDDARLLTANGLAGGPRVLLEGGRLARCARRLGHAAAGMRMLTEAAAGEALAGGVLWGSGLALTTYPVKEQMARCGAASRRLRWPATVLRQTAGSERGGGEVMEVVGSRSRAAGRTGAVEKGGYS